MPIDRRTDAYLRFGPFIAALEAPAHLSLLYSYKRLLVEVIFTNALVIEQINSLTAAEAAKKYNVTLAVPAAAAVS